MDLKGIILQVPSNQIKSYIYYYFTLQLGTFVIFFLFHIEFEGKCGWIIGGGGAKGMLPPPSQSIGGGSPPSSYAYVINHTEYQMGKALIKMNRHATLTHNLCYDMRYSLAMSKGSAVRLACTNAQLV